MIPLRSTERVYSRTTVTIALIVVNLAIFLFQAAMDPYSMDAFVAQWGIVPDQLRLITLFTSMFLHGGWMHVLGNMLFLWVFGRSVEDLIGGPKFLVFYILCGLIAGVAQVIVNPYSRIPTIGASGAIAGVMGAYLLKFPRSRILSLVTVFVFFTTMEVPAPLLLILWLVIQFFSGIGSLARTDYTGGGVAFFAHIGGFLGGMLLIKLFPPRRRFRAWYEEE
jgi:membrane associated rhomboid family serine protease